MLVLNLIGVATMVVLAVMWKRMRLVLLLLLSLLLLSLLLHMHCGSDVNRDIVPSRPLEGTPIKPYDCAESKTCTPPGAPLDAGSP